MANYPTERQLKKITDFSILKKRPEELIGHLRALWHWPDWGFYLKGKNVLRLELHTGGWSGNEDIVIALKKNYLFWSMFWQKSTRGGHHYFRIELKRK